MDTPSDHTMSSPLETLAHMGLLDDVAFFVGTDSFLGGPSRDLVSLMCTSRTIYTQLRVEKNPLLYARIFQHKFDTAAPERRLGPGWTSNECYAAELRKRCVTLNRIRHLQLSVDTDDGRQLLDDLWTAYTMLLENDGKNEAQLLDGARLQAYLQRVVGLKASLPHTHPRNWLDDVEGTSLTLWLIWLTQDKDYVSNESPRDRALMMALLRVFIVAGFRFPSFHAPDSHHLLPLETEFTPTPAPSACGPQPPARTIMHYGRPLTLATPSLTTAAQLLLSARYTVILPANARSYSALNLPRTRAEADALGLQGPTIADFDDFGSGMSVRFIERCQRPDDTPSGDRDSCRLDHDWGRVVGCHDFYAGQSVLREIVYRPGMLSGCWRGFIVMPDWQRYMTMVNQPQRQSAAAVPWVLQPFYCRLREHHCCGYSDWPIPPGTDDQEWGDDISNAWFPRWASPIHERNGGIEIYDHEYNGTTRYATYRASEPDPYSSSQTETKAISEEDSWGPTYTEDGLMFDGPLPPPVPSAGEVPIDIDHAADEMMDTVQRKSSGVSDIIITGETGGKYGDAWGHFKIIGRVRPWDGLVVLLRSDPANSTFGRWLFRGYVVNGNLVGRWREAATPVPQIGFEGTFTLSRSDVTW